MFKPAFVRGYGNYDTDVVSRETSLLCEDESLTLQSEKEDADINVIVKRFGVTGRLPEALGEGLFGDFTEVHDFRSAQDALISARQAFMDVPADVRARFGHDPAQFVDFVTNEKNIDELRAMGLAIAKKKEDTPVPPVVPPEPIKEKANGDSGKSV
jgi:hypothetical protein